MEPYALLTFFLTAAVLFGGAIAFAYYAAPRVSVFRSANGHGAKRSAGYSKEGFSAWNAARVVG